MKRKSESATDPTLRRALERAAELHIRHLVVASTGGGTALRLAELLPRGTAAVCVTHQSGFRGPGRNELDEADENRLAAAGIPVLRTTHLFGGVERAVRLKFGGLGPAETIASTFRTFGQGTKVCVEVAVMALDAGLIPFGRDIVAVAGTGTGADTALVVRPAYSRHFFDTQIREVIAKPRSW